MKVKILLVDDEPSIRTTLKIILELEGFEVVTAASAAEARKTLHQSCFDLVLTDMNMETPDAGFLVVDHANALHRRPAIVIITAFPVTPAEWKAAGADALIVKGTDIKAMLRTVRELAESVCAK
jgi:CheY-like chemotaxis protein